MSNTLFYIIPLILGRTFDLNKMQVGVDIFPNSETSSPNVLKHPVTETRYKIVDNTEDVRDMLDVSGSISLNVKSGVVKGGVAGAYLADTHNRENTVEILVKATYETETHTLPIDARPVETWKSMSALGTHYVKSVTYGGELIASVRLICNNTRNKKDIKGALEAGGQLEGIDLGIEVEGGYLSDVSKSVESMQIKVYSSVPLSRIPHNIKELEAMLDRFPDDMKAYNDGKGVPIKVELRPLDQLDSTRPRFIQNRVLEAHLDLFEQKFDDLINTKAAVSDWMKVMTEPLTDDQEKKVGAFYKEVSDILKKFHEVIGNLDMSGGLSQLEPALKAYGKVLPGHFFNRYRKLRESMVHDQGEWSRYRGNGGTYVHWGTRNCTRGAEKITFGYAVGPSRSGGGSNFMCFEEKPTSKTSKKLTLVDVAYKTGSKSQSLLCSTCRLPSKGSVRTFPGTSNCPKDWSFVYSGLLLAGREKINDMDLVCLDSKAEVSDQTSSDVQLVPTYMSMGSLKNVPYPCVVCSL